MPLQDNDPRKWDYPLHTRAKHSVLSRYSKAWMSILGRSGRRSGRSYLTIVDGFAGRGRYNEGQEGSPLIFRRIAADVISRGIADKVELHFIEANADNHASLVAVLDTEPSPLSVVTHPPILGDFAEVAPAIIADIRAHPRPSFWFIDPFGFTVPFTVVRSIMALPYAEVFFTLMTRDANRFLENPHHRGAVATLLDLDGPDLDAAVREIAASNARMQALRELYERRLRESTHTTYVWSFRVAADGAYDTVYYLIHASKHIKAFKEMKDATKESGGGSFAFLGRDDFAARAQLPLFDMDGEGREDSLLEVYRGRDITFEALCNEAYPDARFYTSTETDFRKALTALVDEGVIDKVPVDTKGKRGLQGKDRLIFPDRPREGKLSAGPVATQGTLW